MKENENRANGGGRPDAREVLYKLIQTNRLHRRVIERRSENLGLHCSAHRMLFYISREDTVPSQKILAEALKISPAAVANTLKKLETDGYIERVKCKDSSDSRANSVTVTERGRIAVSESEKYFRYVDTAALSGFTDGEIDTFVYMLEKIQKNLNEAVASSSESEA